MWHGGGQSPGVERQSKICTFYGAHRKLPNRNDQSYSFKRLRWEGHENENQLRRLMHSLKNSSRGRACGPGAVRCPSLPSAQRAPQHSALPSGLLLQSHHRPFSPGNTTRKFLRAGSVKHKGHV